MTDRTVQVRIYGKVQGVSYRVWVRREASALGLAGWVRNEVDGSVTALIAGTGAAVSTMIERLWQGPPEAAVSKVDVEDIEARNTSAGFRIVA
ncbi:acylphosphatase [Mesorhizobium sp. M0048]|uniref:acylphosphatase n=1 Tax=Mesorhizobium sp. M0048 TaxID=2956860 RepID=UPI00333C6A79